MIRAIDDNTLSGVVNATSPNPVRNYELTDTIASFFGRRAGSFCPPRCCVSASGAAPLTRCCSRAKKCCRASWKRPASSMPTVSSTAPSPPPSAPAPQLRGWAQLSLCSVEVGAVATDVVVDGVIGVDGLAGVAPEALLHVVADEALGDIVVVHVGDLELAAP